jgi:Lipid A 3-O-deacylase (PagL)
LQLIINSKLTKQFSFLTICLDKKYLYVLFMSSIIPFFTPLYAQKGISIATTLHGGWLVKHSADLTFKPVKPSVAQCVNVMWQTYGKREWETLHHYPKIGLALLHYDLGERNIEGEAFGIFPNMNFTTQQEKLTSTFTFGTGVAYLTQTYNRLTNPTFNAIGSHFNNITTVQYHVARPLNAHWAVTGGASLTHFSNGNAQIPNFGANILAISAGATYMPQPVQATDYLSTYPSAEPQHKWGVHLAFSRGTQELVVVGGAKYPVYRGGLMATYQLSPVNKLIGGVDYEFFKSIYDFGLHTYYFTNKDEAFRKASRVGVALGDEVFFGNVSFIGQLGYYLTERTVFLRPASVYNRLSVQYYPPIFKGRKNRFFCNITIKAHYGKAEYIALGVGGEL